MKYKVGVVGNGFVGEAISFAFSPTADLRVYDIDPLKSTHSKEEVDECDFIFVCVPTPMHKNGEQDLKYIENVFETAVEGPIYIIKSTVLPGTTDTLAAKFPKLSIGKKSNEEFMRVRTIKVRKN